MFDKIIKNIYKFFTPSNNYDVLTENCLWTPVPIFTSFSIAIKKYLFFRPSVQSNILPSPSQGEGLRACPEFVSGVRWWGSLSRFLNPPQLNRPRCTRFILNNFYSFYSCKYFYPSCKLILI